MLTEYKTYALMRPDGTKVIEAQGTEEMMRRSNLRIFPSRYFWKEVPTDEYIAVDVNVKFDD